MSGGFVVNYRNNVGCTGAILETVTGVYSGSCLYDPTTCANTDTGQLGITTVSGFCPPSTIPTCDFVNSFTCGGTLIPPLGGVTTTIISQTQKQQTVGTSCGGPSGSIETASANGVITLSDLDLPADAIARLIAVSPWSTWVNPAPGFCTSSWGINDIPGGFTYIEAQFQYNAIGLLPSHSYTLTLDVYQSVFGMGSFTMIGTITASFTTDASGNATVTGNVPITQGYDTYVTNPVVT